MIRPSRFRSKALLAACLALLLSTGLAACAAPPALTAESAILVDAATGQVLFQKNAHQQRPIASTTKIMTALLAIEHGSLQDPASVSKEAAAIEGSRLGLQAGDLIRVDALLNALLIRSANDAAVVLAEHIGPGRPRFVELMNRRAWQLGAYETHFANPHGLYDPNHYSTAYDLALISREAMKQPLFRELVGTRTCSLIRPDGSEFPLINHNKLLFRDPAVDGIKTGYVKESGRCLVASASHGGWRLIAVLLNSTDLWGDGKALLDYGFANWQATVFAGVDIPVTRLRVIGGRTGRIPILPQENLVEVRSLQAEKSGAEAQLELQRLFAPVRRGQVVGRLRLVREGREVGGTLLLAGADSEPALWLTALRILGRIILVCAIAVAGLKLYGKIAKAARRRRRRLPAEG